MEFTEEQIAEIKQRNRSCESQTEIAESLGVGIGVIRRIAGPSQCRWRHRLAKPDPSQAEIREACLAIQETWDWRTRQERAGCFAERPYEFRAVRVVDIVA